MEIEEDEDKFIKENPIIFKKYKVKKKIGEGAFGDVYLGQSISNNAYVAIKTELRKIIKPILESEAFLLYSIAGPGIPEVKSFGKTKKYNILVEPLLGKSLFDIFAENHKTMSLPDVCLIGKQVIDRIQWVHSKNIVHRDIKPDNFLIGRNDPNVLYLIDFGLSKKFRSTTTGKHIRFGFTGKLTGTVRFASANALRGGEQSRRDDIESIGYMLIYFLKKRLPWQSITGNKKIERYLKIYKMKKNIAPEKLCEGLPPEMAQFINYAKNLEFEQEPDYKYLNKLFDNVLKRINTSNENLIFSWIKMTDLTNLKTPINLTTRKDSPQSRIYKKIKTNLEKGKYLSSDSESKIGTYNQISSSQGGASNNIQLINNQNVYSEDQFESTKDKNILNKSMKSKEGLNTTVANLDVTVDENVVYSDNEKILKDFDESNKNNKKINRNLKPEFNSNKDSNINDSNNKKKEENSNNKNKNLSNNISDNSNNALDNELDNNKDKKDETELKIQNKELNENNNDINNKIKNQIKVSNSISYKNVKKNLDAADFTFNETINTNNNIANNNKPKEKENQNNIINNNKNKINIDNNQNKQIQTNNLKEKNNINNNNKKINNKFADNNNKDKLIKKKITKSEKKVAQKNNTKLNYKKLNLVQNTAQNKSANKQKEIKKDNNEYNIINQISKETNNNIYNISDDDEIDFNIDNIRKRPSVGPAINPPIIKKYKIGKKVNNKNNFSEKKKNIIKEENIITNKDKTEKKLHQIKSDKDFPYNNTDFNMNEKNDDVNCDTLKAINSKKLKNKTLYKGSNSNYKSYHTIDKNIRKKLNLIPEDNNFIKEPNMIQDDYFQSINNTNNYPENSVTNRNSTLKPHMTQIKNLNNINNIKFIKKENSNISKSNKNTRIVKLNNNNNNNTIRKISTSTNNSIKKITLNSTMDKIGFGSQNLTKVPKNLNQIRIINNNNYNPNVTYRNNLSRSTYHPIINNQIMTNSQINYQFPVYINNNNNIYNTQYLNTVRNIPLVQNINNLNNTITIQPAPIQTNLNFGQNLGIQFVNTNPNNFNNIRYNIIPNKTTNYQFRKKYNVSLVKK